MTFPAILELHTYHTEKSNGTSDGCIKGLYYWQAAHAYSAIILHDKWSGRAPSLKNTIWNQFVAVRGGTPFFMVQDSDDNLWWALALLDFCTTYTDTRKTSRHVSCRLAQKIAEHVKKSVVPPAKYTVQDHDMGGAVLKSNKTSEDETMSLTTGLYAELLARLAMLDISRPARQQHLNGALASFNCLADVFTVDSGAGVTAWAYLKGNRMSETVYKQSTGQGISAAVAVVRYHWTVHKEYTKHPALNWACRLAREAMARSWWHNDAGVLTWVAEYPGGRSQEENALENRDAVGYKSILIRGLTKLYLALYEGSFDQDLQDEISAFVHTQYNALIDVDTDKHNRYGPWWGGPLSTPTAHSQYAVMDVMAAMHAVQMQ